MLTAVRCLWVHPEIAWRPKNCGALAFNARTVFTFFNHVPDLNSRCSDGLCSLTFSKIIFLILNLYFIINLYVKRFLYSSIFALI